MVRLKLTKAYLTYAYRYETEPFKGYTFFLYYRTNPNLRLLPSRSRQDVRVRTQVARVATLMLHRSPSLALPRWCWPLPLAACRSRQNVRVRTQVAWSFACPAQVPPLPFSQKLLVASRKSLGASPAAPESLPSARCDKAKSKIKWQKFEVAS